MVTNDLIDTRLHLLLNLENISMSTYVSTYLKDEHVFAHIFCQCEEASLRVVPGVSVQFLVIRIQGLFKYMKERQLLEKQVFERQLLTSMSNFNNRREYEGNQKRGTVIKR